MGSLCPMDGGRDTKSLGEVGWYRDVNLTEGPLKDRGVRSRTLVVMVYPSPGFESVPGRTQDRRPSQIELYRNQRETTDPDRPRVKRGSLRGFSRSWTWMSQVRSKVFSWDHSSNEDYRPRHKSNTKNTLPHSDLVVLPRLNPYRV